MLSVIIYFYSTHSSSIKESGGHCRHSKSVGGRTRSQVFLHAFFFGTCRPPRGVARSVFCTGVARNARLLVPLDDLWYVAPLERASRIVCISFATRCDVFRFSSGQTAWPSTPRPLPRHPWPRPCPHTIPTSRADVHALAGLGLRPDCFRRLCTVSK